MDAANFLARGFAVLGLAGAAYSALTVWAAGRYLRLGQRNPAAAAPFTPPVSILKSLKGLDADMYTAFASHCALDYPEYELLFGMHDPGDPALPLLHQLSRSFPQHDIRVIYCPEVLGPNGKVSNLAQMLLLAHHEHIVINDSDIVVPRDYLLRVMAPLQQPKAGMATTLYRGTAAKSLGSRLEALGLSSDFAGGVLLARAMEGGLGFALGATIATTKTMLHQIGGLEPLADFLGDDYELGARTAAAGYKVELADTVVETTLANYSFGEFWRHQMRWARNVKDRRPGKYFGLIVTFGLAWATMAVVACPLRWWTWAVLAITAAMRALAALTVGQGVLRDRQVLRDWWLLPLRDFVGLGIWVASFLGNTVEWRGERFRLRKGKMEKIN